MTTLNQELRKREHQGEYLPEEQKKEQTLLNFDNNFTINRIYLEDVFKLIKKIDDLSLDLVIVDPPYGDGIGYGRNNKEIINNEDETINYMFLDDIYPKMNNNTCLYLFTNWKFECKLRKYIENETKFKIRMLIVMVKNNFGMGYGFRNQYELCLVLEKGNPKYNLNNFSNVQFVNHINQDENSHPHEKDVLLMQKIINHSSNEGNLVFDGFVGSGTTCIACKQLNRNYIGAEIDERWFEIAKKRIKQSNIKKWF